MEAFTASILLVALAEIGDKTQLLSLYLAARYRAPLSICSGIALATIANHALAAWLGSSVAGWIEPTVLRWVLGASFLAFGFWALSADSLSTPSRLERRVVNVLLLTTIAFFLIEMGDKTQVATVALAARYQSVWVIAAGTTIGMLIANVPAVLAGHMISDRLPVAWIRRAAAASFAIAGIAILLGY